MHHIADAVHVDDDVVLAVAVDDALELADHRAATFSSALGAMMRMRHRDGERVGGVLGLRIGLRQQHADHQADLRLLGVAGADDRLLHQVRRVFGDQHAGLRRHQQRDAARLPELQRRDRVAVDEGRLDRGLVGPEFVDDARQPVMDRHQPLGERELLVGLDRAARQVDQPVALAADQAPAGAAEARVDAEDANRLCHRGPLIAPRSTLVRLLDNAHSLPDSIVIDLPDRRNLLGRRRRPRFALALGVSVLSGAVRGFSGFGSALIYVPLMSALYGPKIGAASFLLIDFVTGIVFSLGVWRQAAWREIVPLAVSAIIAAPFGTLILQYADPAHLRWAMAALVLVIVVVLSTGWRYHGKPMLIVTVLVGLVAGVLGGRGADLRTAGRAVLALLDGGRGGGARELRGVLRHHGGGAGRHVSVVRPAYHRRDRARGVPGARPYLRDVRWIEILSYGIGADLSPRRLRDHHVRRAGQHAAVGRVVTLTVLSLRREGSSSHALIFCDQRVRHLEIRIHVLHVVLIVQRIDQLQTFSPCSSSTGTVFCGFQVSAALRGSPNFASNAFATSRSDSLVV